jgi:16S rRNA (uracil1498-N3)-methyltransferase
MAPRRFFVSADSVRDGTFVITGSDARHIASVLRMSEGDRLSLVMGDGRECIGVIVSASPSEVRGEIVSYAPSEGEPAVKITIIQCIPKGDKMDLIVQKCVEIGVTSIIPAMSERSVVKLQPDRAERRVERWRRIAEEASKQSGRSAIPSVSNVVSFADAVSSSFGDSLRLIPFELEREHSLKAELERTRPAQVVFCIGPEGGLTLDEVSLAQSYGFVPITLGRRILRTETAGLVVAACILYQMDELG